MSQTPQRSPVPSSPTLSDSIALLEGRVPVAELARRVVQAALLQPGVTGARLWKAERAEAELWAEAGSIPDSATPPVRDSASPVESNSRMCTFPLGSDDFRMRLLTAYGADSLSEDTRSRLGLLARFAALALALAERRGAMEELSGIVEATKRLNSTLDLGELIHIILQIATRQTGAERGTVFLLDAQRNEIWSLVGLGLEQQVIRLPADRGIAGWVAQHGRAIRLEDAYNDARFEPEVDKRLGFTTKRLLCLPIRNEDGKIIGVLQLLNKQEPFTDEDEAFLDALSVHVSLALEKAQLHRERVEKEKLERDLSLAREIQAGLLPEAPPQLAGLDIAVSHRASQMVGGDYYDFLSVGGESGHKTLIVVADVEGKGAASALVMANVQATLHALAGHAEPVEKLPALINEKMLAASGAGRRTKYLSMFLALLSPDARRLRYVNAGHVPPALIRADGQVEWLESGGMVVGLLPGAEYESAEIELNRGDLLVACTDGITEAMNSRGEEFGRPRLASLLARLRAEKAKEALDAVLEEVDAHSLRGIYEDDRVLMVLKAI